MIPCDSRDVWTVKRDFRGFVVPIRLYRVAPDAPAHGKSHVIVYMGYMSILVEWFHCIRGHVESDGIVLKWVRE